MKGSRIFWGMFFLFVGAVILLRNFELVHFHWYLTAKLWPLILVLWGLSMFIENKVVRWVLLAVAGLVLGSIAVGLFSGDWFDGNDDSNYSVSSGQVLMEPYAQDIRHATFLLEAGAGHYSLLDTTKQLAEATTELSYGKFVLNRDRSDESEDLRLEMRGHRTGWHWSGLRNHADIRLNANPVWDLRFNVGASRLKLDLTPYNVEELRVDAGASTMKIRMGAESDETRASIHCGVSSINIEVPSSAGCEIRDHAELSFKNFKDGFEKISGGTYRTDNFQTASKKIYLSFDAGVSKIHVSRY
jgi:hypothetical protein